MLEGGGDQQLKAETCEQEPCTQPYTTTITNTSAINDTIRHEGYKNLIQQVVFVLSSSFLISYTCYQYTAVGKCCTLCVQIVWLLAGANWHEAPWKLGLFTFLIVKWTLLSACFNRHGNDANLHFVGQADKNIERHTADTSVSWPNPKQWVTVHKYDLMMTRRQSIYILSIITREIGKLKTYSPPNCILDYGDNVI